MTKETDVAGIGTFTGTQPLPSPVTFVRHWKHAMSKMDPGDIQRSLKSGKAAIRDVPCGTCTACCRAGMTIKLTEGEKARFGVEAFEPLANGHCPHLKETGCDIYAERPMLCRTFDCRMYAYLRVGPNGPIGEAVRTKWASPPIKTHDDWVTLVAMAFAFKAAREQTDDLDHVANFAFFGHEEFKEIAKQWIAHLPPNAPYGVTPQHR
jgi:hypothetical protein